MKNIFYFYNINKIGGIETFFYQLAKKYKDWDITIYYQKADKTQLERLKQYVKVKKYRGEKIVCEKAFFNFNLDIINNVDAKEYGLILHGDYKAMVEAGQLNKELVPKHPKIDKYYGVSQVVCDSFEELTGIKATLLYNPFEVLKPKRVLRLISATRLTKEKGKKRMLQLIKELDKKEIPFTWTIFTDDTNIIDHPNVFYKRPQLDILSYVADADYLVQLSDNEGYCYSVVEALSVGTPVIVTDLPVFKELGLKNKINSFILPLSMKEIPINEIYNNNLQFTYTPKEDNWNKFLAPGKSTYVEDRKKTYKVIATKLYKTMNIKDKELGYIPNEGQIWEVDYERMNVLTGDNDNNLKFVEIYQKIDK